MINEKRNMVAQRKSKTGTQIISAPLIIAATILAAYSSVLSTNFAIMDDYTFLYNAITRSHDTLTLLIGAGRPLNGALLDWGFRSAGSIEGLSILRAFTLTGIWLLGCGLYYFSRLHSVAPARSLAIACGIILLPSFQVYASWAQHFTTPFAGAIALLSAFVLSPACALREHSRALAILFSALLMFVSTLIYQPMTMLFCVGILISILSKPNISFDWTPSRIIDAVIAFIIAMLSGLIAFKIGQAIYPSNSARYGFTDNISAKISWFISEPMMNALSLYSVPGNRIHAMIVLSAIVLGIVFFLRRHDAKTHALILIYTICCLIGSYLPNLVTAENWASYRSIGALSAATLVLVVFLATEPFEYLLKKYSETPLVIKLRDLISPVLFFLLITAAIKAQGSLLNGFVLPNVAELDNLTSILISSQSRVSKNTEITIRASSWTDSTAKPIAYDEFGIPSSSNEFYAKEMVYIVLRSLNIAPHAILRPSKDSDDGVIIDFRHLVTSQKFKTAPSARLYPGTKNIVPCDITDMNWTNGIWTNTETPGLYSFTYQSEPGGEILKAGDKLVFNRSGVRAVLRVDLAGNYINVLVDGRPLHKQDGNPHPITRHHDK